MMVRDQLLRFAGRLRLGHRVRALRGAAVSVQSPWRLLAWELAFLPLRPLVMIVGRLRGASPADAWRAITEPFGGQICDYRLRDGGRRVSIRRGTADIFTLYETQTMRIYEPPPQAMRALENLGATLRILDLGGNIGLYALEALSRWPRASIVSFEPDPENLLLLRRNVATNADAQWRVVDACAAVSDGRAPFVTGHFAVSRAPAHGERSTSHVAAVDVFPYLVACDLLKMDIEGGEWPILLDERLRTLTARVVVLEYHSWGCPTNDPEKLARDALERVGFVVGPAQQLEAGAGTFWAWR